MTWTMNLALLAQQKGTGKAGGLDTMSTVILIVAAIAGGRPARIPDGLRKRLERAHSTET